MSSRALRLPITRRLGGLTIRGDYVGNVDLVGFDGTAVRIEAADIGDVIQALTETSYRHRGKA